MAVCKWCDRDMADPAATTCAGNEAVRLPGGASLPSVPHDPGPMLTPDEWMAAWRESRAEFARLRPDIADDDTEEKARGRCAAYQARGGRCRDCGVMPGGRHHPGCDAEQCPLCGGRLISCGCLEGPGGSRAGADS